MIENYFTKKQTRILYDENKTSDDIKKEKLEETILKMDQQVYIVVENAGEAARATIYSCFESDNSILKNHGTANYNDYSMKLFFKKHLPSWSDEIRTKTIFFKDVTPKKSKKQVDIEQSSEPIFEQYILDEDEYFKLFFSILSNSNSCLHLHTKPNLYNQNEYKQTCFGLFEIPVLYDSLLETPMFDLITQFYNDKEDVKKVMIWFYLVTYHKHIYPSTQVNQLLWLYSNEGGTGKSSIGNLFYGYFGDTLSTNFNTSQDTNNFKGENVVGKYFIHADEVRTPSFIEDNDIIWAIASNTNDAQVNLKGKKQIGIDASKMTVVLTSNTLPAFKESDSAIQRRLLVIQHGEKQIKYLFESNYLTGEPAKITKHGLIQELPNIISNGHYYFKEFLKDKKMTGVDIPWDNTKSSSQLPMIIADIKANHIRKGIGSKLKRSDFTRLFLKNYITKNGYSHQPKTILDEMVKLGILIEKNYSNVPYFINIELKEESLETYTQERK